jgi:hypothetical protein
LSKNKNYDGGVMKRIYAVSLMALMVVFLAGCDLSDLANNSLKISKAVGVIQTETLRAYNSDPQLIDKESKDGILTVCLVISRAGKQFDAVLATVSKLDPASRTKLLDALVPISQSLDAKEIAYIARIKNPDSVLKIEKKLAVVRTALSAMQIILASSGG